MSKAQGSSDAITGGGIFASLFRNVYAMPGRMRFGNPSGQLHLLKPFARVSCGRRALPLVAVIVSADIGR